MVSEGPRGTGQIKLALAQLALTSALLLGLLLAPNAVASSPVFSPVPGSPFRLPSSGAGAEFSPNGRMLAVSSLGESPGGHLTWAITVFALEADGRLKKLPESVVAGSETDLGPFNPDGRSVLICGGRRNVSVHSVTTRGIGAVEWRGSAANTYCEGSFSPDGRVLAFDHGNLTTYTVAETGALDHVPGTPFGGSAFNSLAFSPSDGFVAATRPNFSGGSRESVVIYSVTPEGVPSKAPVSSVLAGPGMERVEFSPDGEFVAAMSYSGSVHGIWMYRVDPTGVLKPVPGSPFTTMGGGGSISFSADGKLLATNDEQSRHVVVYAIQPDGALRRAAVLTTAHNTNIGPESVAFSPTEKRLAVINRADGTVSVFAYR
jgi:WD40 repeat protein